MENTQNQSMEITENKLASDVNFVKPTQTMKPLPTQSKSIKKVSFGMWMLSQKRRFVIHKESVINLSSVRVTHSISISRIGKLHMNTHWTEVTGLFCVQIFFSLSLHWIPHSRISLMFATLQRHGESHIDWTSLFCVYVLWLKGHQPRPMSS